MQSPLWIPAEPASVREDIHRPGRPGQADAWWSPAARHIMTEYATASIATAALQHTLRLLRDRVGPAVKLCAVVKADAYGHGLEGVLGTIAPLVDWLAVAVPGTAHRLRELGYAGPVLVMFSAAAYDARTRRLEIA